jgi:hypothetical protein
MTYEGQTNVLVTRRTWQMMESRRAFLTDVGAAEAIMTSILFNEAVNSSFCQLDVTRFARRRADPGLV